MVLIKDGKCTKQPSNFLKHRNMQFLSTMIIIIIIIEWSAAAGRRKNKTKNDTLALRGKIKLAWCHLYIEEHSLWQLWITYIMIIFTIKVKAVNRRRLAFSNLNKFRPAQKPVKRSA